MDGTSVSQWAFALAAGGVLLMTVPGFVLYARMLARLRRGWPEEWRRLGRPTVIFYASRADRRALHRWVEQGGFESLGDPDFARACRRYRLYARLYGVALAAVGIAFVAVLAARALG
jgi:hypothetical protein